MDTVIFVILLISRLKEGKKAVNLFISNFFQSKLIIKLGCAFYYFTITFHRQIFLPSNSVILSNSFKLYIENDLLLFKLL